MTLACVRQADFTTSQASTAHLLPLQPLPFETGPPVSQAAFYIPSAGITHADAWFIGTGDGTRAFVGTRPAVLTAWLV